MLSRDRSISDEYERIAFTAFCVAVSLAGLAAIYVACVIIGGIR